MAKNKKHRRPVPKTCDPGLGPEETVFVLEDWEPTEHFLQCRREARHE